MPLPEGKTSYTYADLMLTEENERIELIYGKPFFKPSGFPTLHQTLSREIFMGLVNHVKRGELLMGPLAIRLFEQEGEEQWQVDTVVEPDIIMLCDGHEFDDLGYRGGPDFIVEILADFSLEHDRRTKYELYQKAGVREYWIADPESETIAVHTLEDGLYCAPAVYTSSSTIPISVLDGVSLDLKPIFDEVRLIKDIIKHNEERKSNPVS